MGHQDLVFVELPGDSQKKILGNKNPQKITSEPPTWGIIIIYIYTVYTTVICWAPWFCSPVRSWQGYPLPICWIMLICWWEISVKRHNVIHFSMFPVFRGTMGDPIWKDSLSVYQIWTAKSAVFDDYSWLYSLPTCLLFDRKREGHLH